MPKTPYTNFHELNQDWIIKTIKKMFSPDNPPPYPVESVNGKTGEVVLTGEDIDISEQNQTSIKAFCDALLLAIQAKYTLPSTGLPWDDLAQAVKDIINGKYNLPSGGVPWDDLSTGVKNTINSKYTLPANGIPMSQLDSNVSGLIYGAIQANGSQGSNGQIPVSNGTYSIWTNPGDIPSLASAIATAVNTWLTANITNPSSPPLDRSLTQDTAAAPADLVGDLKSAVSPYVDAWYPAKYNIQQADFPYNGYIATASGAVVGPSDTNWLNTDFIKVDEGTVIEGKLILGLAGVVNSVSCYGSDYSYRASDSLSAKLEGTFTVPSGVSFVRFCCGSVYTGQYIKISSGAYKQGYIPFANNCIYGAKKNTNLIMIGDSYGIQDSDSDITKFFWEYVRDGLKLTADVDFFKKFVVGTGFGSGGFLSNLISLEANITNKETITDIFVCGGWNDSDPSQSYGTDAAFAAGILAFDNYVKDTYPNARISLAHVSWGRLGEGMRTQLHRSFRRYVKASNTYGWRYITNSEYILHDYTTSIWQTDGAHPNNNGQQLLGESIVSAFLTGTADVYYSSELSALTAYGYAPAISGNVYSEVNNNMCRVWSNSTNGLIEITGFTNNGLTPSGATEYAIAKTTTPYFRGYQHYSCVETGCVLLANNKKYNGTAKLRFDGDTLYARFYVPHENVDTWINNLTNVYLVDFDLQVATIRA